MACNNYPGFASNHSNNQKLTTIQETTIKHHEEIIIVIYTMHYRYRFTGTGSKGFQSGGSRQRLPYYFNTGL